MWQIDEHPQKTAFSYLELPVSRMGPDGKVWAPDERVDRVTILKAATSWASEYVLRPDNIGTLEKGKWADFLVLNQDYFTIPEQEISEVHPLMTVVGGDIVYLDPAFAQEIGQQPVGYQHAGLR